MPLTPSQIEAYQNSTYRVWTGTEGITFHIGERTEKLDALLEEYGVRTAIFITAHNPYSEVAGPHQNKMANLKLLVELRNRRRFEVLKGGGYLGKWSEPSFLVLGPDIDLLLDLVDRYGQNAAVFISLGKPVELVIAPQAGTFTSSEAPTVNPEVVCA